MGKNKAYPIGRSDGYHYLKITELVNPQKTGYVQRIEKMEKYIFDITEEKLEIWRRDLPEPFSISVFYDALDKKVRNFYAEEGISR